MRFQWDQVKARENRRKHRIDFADAVSIFEDERALTMEDEDGDEERFVTMGVDLLGRVLVVVFTWRGDDIRLISARKATGREKAAYEG